MYQETASHNDIESKSERALLSSMREDYAKSEQILLDVINNASLDADRFFPYLYYGELLINTGRWEEARDILLGSAQIALNQKDDYWLVLSHEKLGDLSAAQGNWFGALHQYRYTLRKAAALLDRFVLEKLEAKSNAAQKTLHTLVLPQDSTILPLSREYLSDPMAISFVHRDIFLKKYFAHCLQCNFCHDWCCSFGADVDIQNVERIQDQKEEILPFVRPPEGEWFEGEYTYYEEYAGNQYTRINPQGPRCAFISKEQRGCGLHRYAISKHIDDHEIKPLVCILFPLSFGEGILSLAPELDDNSLICSGSGYSAYHAMRNELEFYFGHECVQDLDGIEKDVLST